MEQFIFDAFPYAPSTALFEVKASLVYILLNYFRSVLIALLSVRGSFFVSLTRSYEKKSLHQ